MAIVIFQNALGRNYTFQLFEKDGITPRNITGLTLTWRFKDTGDPSILLSLPCVITDALNGKFYATMTATITGTAPRTFICQIEVLQTTVLLDPSEEFVVNIKKSAAVAG